MEMVLNAKKPSFLGMALIILAISTETANYKLLTELR